MTCWVVVPIKAPEACKTRLSGALSDEARMTLVRAMLGAVLAAATGAAGVDRIVLLGPADYRLPAGVDRLDDPGGGLNATLSHARDTALAAGATRLIVLPADLPTIATADVEHLATLGRDQFGIAPDRAETGTNALSLPLPHAATFAFAFGDDSFARHRNEAIRLGLPIRILASPGLAADIDLPADLALLS